MTEVPPTGGEGWERQTLEKLATAALTEQRRARNWGILFKTAFLVWLFIALFSALGWINRGDATSNGRHTALVELKGVIDSEGQSSADKIITGLQDAFKDHNTQGVVLRINSPGGSPVQSGYIYDEMKRLRALHPTIPLYVVVQDICASGGYYVASAASKIYVDKASLIGSIGVLMDGFGFTETMNKLGVERRLLTAGENKGFLDPFSPLNPKHEAHARAMLGQIHAQFIKAVRDGRGNRLKETPDTFSGLIWSGEEGLKQGIADEFGSLEYVAREVIKAEDIVDFSVKENVAERLAKRLGAATSQVLLDWFDRPHVQLR